MKPKPTSSDEALTAIHEAGHAVIAVAYGLTVAYATIEPAEFLRHESESTIDPLDGLYRTLQALGPKAQRYRSAEYGDAFDILAQTKTDMIDGKPLRLGKAPVLELLTQIEETGNLSLLSQARRAKSAITRYRAGRIATSGHVRVRDTPEQFDQLIMRASGGAAVRHFFLSSPIAVDALDGLDNEQIEDSLVEIYPGPDQASLRSAVGANLRHEAAQAVELNSGFIEDLAYELEIRKRMDSAEIDEVLALSSERHDARISRVRPPAKRR